MPFLRLQTGQERWHPKWQTTLQMRVLSQAFQRREKAKPQHPLAALQRRQAKRRTACRAVRIQPQNHPSSPCQSRYTGRLRAATGTCEPHHGHHLFRPKMGRHGSLRRSQQARLGSWQSSGKPTRSTHRKSLRYKKKGGVIQSIICDGKSGLLGSFPDIPVQM